MEQTVEMYPGPFSVGPRKVHGALCDDGTRRTATCSNRGADTFFSIPARVKADGRTVSGYVTREERDGFGSDTEVVWKFKANRWAKNADAIPRPPR